MFHLMNVASIHLTIQLQLFLRHDVSKFSHSICMTLNVKNVCEVISNSDIKLPAHQCQPLSLYHHHHCQVMTQHATHMLCHLFFYFFNFSILFDNVVCNPYAMLSISFISNFFHVVWWCGMQPRCHVIYFLLFSIPLCCLIMQHATHMPHFLFISIFIFSMLFDDMAYSPHAVLCISFNFFFCHVVWSLDVECWLNTYKVYIVCL